MHTFYIFDIYKKTVNHVKKMQFLHMIYSLL